MEKSSAYEAGYAAGQMFGAIFMMVLVVAALGFFIFALVKACTRKTTGWIVTTVIMGVMGLGVLVAGVVLIGVGITKAAKEAGKDKVMASADGRHSLTVPGSWKSMPELNDVASIEGGNARADRYAIVIVEDRKDFEGSLKDYATLLVDHMKADVEKAESNEPESLMIGSYPALRHSISGTVDKVKVTYHHTCVETPKSYCQILCWSLKSDEKAAAPVFDKVAASFVEKAE